MVESLMFSIFQAPKGNPIISDDLSNPELLGIVSMRTGACPSDNKVTFTPIFCFYDFLREKVDLKTPVTSETPVTSVTPVRPPSGGFLDDAKRLFLSCLSGEYP